MTDMQSLAGVDFAEGYIAVIDKPLEWTSTDVVRKIKFALNRAGYRKIKVGHAGTLGLELGATTPSFDMEHPVDRRYPTDHITREMVGEALDRLTGERLQAPPIYSAKKVEGVRAYEFARAGEEVELRKALITVHEIELEEYDLPRMRIRVRCSKGTYIRSLAQEIGEELRSGAYLTSLRRTRSGGFTAENAWKLENFLEKLAELETNR